MGGWVEKKERKGKEREGNISAVQVFYVRVFHGSLCIVQQDDSELFTTLMLSPNFLRAMVTLHFAALKKQLHKKKTW